MHKCRLFCLSVHPTLPASDASAAEEPSRRCRSTATKSCVRAYPRSTLFWQPSERADSGAATPWEGTQPLTQGHTGPARPSPAIGMTPVQAGAAAAQARCARPSGRAAFAAAAPAASLRCLLRNRTPPNAHCTPPSCRRRQAHAQAARQQQPGSAQRSGSARGGRAALRHPPARSCPR